MACENCKKLEIRIAELEEELRNRDDEFSAAEERAARAKEEARVARRKLDAQTREADEAEFFRSTTTGEIARARERGDDVAVARGLEKLKRGW